MAERMATWVLWGVISWQRRFDDYGAAQRAARWDLEVEGRSNRDNCDVRVGVMGFGAAHGPRGAGGGAERRCGGGRAAATAVGRLALGA